MILLGVMLTLGVIVLGVEANVLSARIGVLEGEKLSQGKVIDNVRRALADPACREQIRAAAGELDLLPTERGRIAALLISRILADSAVSEPLRDIARQAAVDAYRAEHTDMMREIERAAKRHWPRPRPRARPVKRKTP